MAGGIDSGRWCGGLAAALFSLALTACGGGGGGSAGGGEPPPEPAPGFDRNEAPEALNPTITDVRVESPIVIEFQVKDGRGVPVNGLRQGENVEFSFTVNKLVAGADGENSDWQSYILSDDEGQPDFQPGTYAEGTFRASPDGNGMYSFTFDRPLEEIDGIAFEPESTHRVGMEIRDPVLLGEEVAGSDGVFDFQPSSGNTTGLSEHKVVKQDSCATCHGTKEFAFHGGPRQDVEYCVTCHQKGAQDYRKGDPVSIDFGRMIHQIHEGSDNAKFCGFTCENFGSPLDDFSEVEHPQDVRNCTNCHDPADPETPQAVNVNNRATAAQCASCHEDLAFDENGLTNANDNHVAGAQPNSSCSTCHAEGALVEPILASHTIPSQEAAKRFEYNILDISQTGEGQSPVVTFSFTDPTNDGQAYDIANDAPFTQTDGSTRIQMLFAWPTSDYTNVANASGTAVTGGAPASPKSVSLVADGTGLPSYVQDNGDGTYSVLTSQLPSPLTVPATTPPLGSGAVSIEGHPAGEFEGDTSFDAEAVDEVPVTGAVKAFAINDASPQPRRSVVDLAKCQACHEQNDGLSLHGSNRTDNIQQCVMCHNPNNTDLEVRPADPDTTVNGLNEGTVANVFSGRTQDPEDDLESQTIDMKYMIHAIHGADIREDDYELMGFGHSLNNFAEVAYPRSSGECRACHEEGSYELPITNSVERGVSRTAILGTTNQTQATVDEAARDTQAGGSFGGATFIGTATDPTDDNNVSPTAAVCTSCHDSDSARDHMSRRGTAGNSQGDGFVADPFADGVAGSDAHDAITNADTQAKIDAAMPDSENCAFCHGPGRSVDIADAHDLGD